MAKKIMIMAGGTGGHVFPALAVAEHLSAQGWTVTWLGTPKGLEAKVVPAHGFEVDWLAVAGLRGKGILAKFKGLLLFVKACWQAFGYLRRRRPNVVLGMGGFVAAPGGLMAKLLGIPLVIHEQNRVAGTTNRLLAKFSNRVLEAFPDTFAKKYHPQYVGNPLRRFFQQPLTKNYWQPHSRPLQVLVVGGSQGAQVLNEIVPFAMGLLKKVQVKHQTGAAMQAQVQQSYDKLDIQVEVLVFIEDMLAAYQWADLVICRAGAMTVSEVAACGLPAVFVPLPHAIDDHQTANARYLTESKAGLMLLQKDLTAESLAQMITENLKNLTDIAQAVKTKAQLQATDNVANICIAEALV